MNEVQKPKITIYYDGVCNLCSGIADTIDSSSKKDSFALVDISKGQLPPGINKEEAMRDVHVVDQHGRVYKGAEAVMKVFEQYPRLKWLGYIGSLPGFRHIAMAIYRVIEKSRYWIFGRKKV